MKNRLYISENEKRRIKQLHSVIKEQELGIDIEEPLKGDDEIKTDVSIIEPSDDEGLEQSQMPAHYHVWKWCKQGGPIVFYPPPSQPGIQGTALQQASTTFYNMMGSPSVGEIIHITLDPSLPQRRMCYEYLGFEVRVGGQYGNLDGAATHWFAPNAVRDPGSFTSCQDCEQGGQQQIQGYCINCEQGQMSYYPGLGNTTSCPPGYSDLGPQIPTQGPCVKCQGGQCSPVGWGYGQNHFNSMSDCQNSPTCNQQVWECVNGSCQSTSGPLGSGQFATLADCQGQCGNFGAGWFCLPPGGQGSCQYTPSMTVGPNGPFPTQADCENSNYCGLQGNTWDCTGSSPFGPPSACQQVSGSGGQFATEDDCLASPCACDDIITTWPLYLNNPNNPQGNWYGTPHDGPSNSNAIQTQLTNLQNNPNFPGNNPVQQHKMKCKEAAMQFWLGSGTGAGACCQDSSFAVGYANNDPLGCVSQGWINQMNTFMSNHAGWPGQGCNWLNNVLANVQAQQTNNGWQPGDTGYCKTQGKIDFINNFKQTGNSTYLTGQAVFPLPCI